MANADHPQISEGTAARILARFSERTTVRRLARGLAGELLLADHEGDIVDPGIDPRVFTRLPADREDLNPAWSPARPEDPLPIIAVLLRAEHDIAQ